MAGKSRPKHHPANYLYSIAAVVATAAGFWFLWRLTSWNWYVVYLIVVNLVTFGLFGLDKGLSKAGIMRIPEWVLHAFTLAGGFVGQFLGRRAFHHKINRQEHPLFDPVLIGGALLTAALFYFFVLR